MKNRDYSYDWLRAFSAVMIVFCHVCQGFGISAALGFYLGGTYVSVFLLLSAYLLGLRHCESIKDGPVSFLKSRLLRLVPTYYVFLTLAFLLIAFLIGAWYLTPRQVLGHYLFLNWFVPSTRVDIAPLPQLGHLWFMSCIVMSYVLIALMAFLPVFSKRGIRFWTCYLFVMLAAGCGMCWLSRFFIYPSVVLALFPPMFYCGRRLVAAVQRLGRVCLICLLLLTNLGSIVAYQFGMRDFSPVAVLLSITVNAVLWIACAPLVFSRNRLPAWVGFISGISFEIYLVHHAFCLGHYSLTHYMPVWAAVPAVFILSISLGYALSILTRNIMKVIKITPPICVRKQLYINKFNSNIRLWQSELNLLTSQL